MIEKIDEHNNDSLIFEFECSGRSFCLDGIVGIEIGKKRVFCDNWCGDLESWFEQQDDKKFSNEERRELADFMKRQWEEFANDGQEEEVWVDAPNGML
jgi:hypothetical protein